MEKYAAYLRKSRAEDAESIEDVLRRHKQKIKETARRDCVVIADWYEEIVSGESISARPEMQRLLEAVADDQYAAVYCMDIDRLGRGDMMDQGMILSAFRLSGTKIVTPDKTYDLQNDADETLTEFRAFIARQEYKMIRKRMRRGTISSIKDGSYLSNPPYGYEACRINKKPSLKIIPEEADFVRLAFDMYCSGSGSKAIAREFNAMGAVPRRGAKFSDATIRYMLRNPVYAGSSVYNRTILSQKALNSEIKIIKQNPEENWIVANGLHDAIISKDQFDLAQNIRVSRSIPPRYDGKIHNQFAGIITCGVCGRKMVTNISARNGSRLMCKQPGCCAAAKISYVENYILSALQAELARLEVADNRDEIKEINARKAKIKTLNAEMAKVKPKEARLYTLLEDGVYDTDTFVDRMQIIKDTKSEISEKIKSEQAIIDNLEHYQSSHIKDTIRSALDLWPSSDQHTRNKILKSIIASAVYYKGKKTKKNDFRIDITLKYF